MAWFDEAGAWSAYNATQQDRPPRPLVQALLEHAGDGGGRLALDLGHGAGVETALLLHHGWRVLAVDGDAAAAASLRARLPTDRLTLVTRDFAELGDLPELHLVHAAWALPYAGRLSDDQVTRLLAPFDVVAHEVVEADGAGFGGPQHWHVHSVVARRSPTVRGPGAGSR